MRALRLFIPVLAVLLAGCLDAPVSWSPDGKQIAFRVCHTHQQGQAAKGTIWIADVAAGSCTLVESCDDGLGAPTWSPDGTQLAWLTGGGEVVVWKAEGASRRGLAKSDPVSDPESIRVHCPSWSPDAKTLACATADGENWTIQVFGASTGESRVLAESSAYPLFSPDGTSILGCRKGAGDSFDLLAWPTAGGEGKPIGEFVRDEVVRENPLWLQVWSPDGKTVATSYASAAGGTKPGPLRIRFCPVDGGPAVEAKTPSEAPLGLAVFAWLGGKQGVLAVGLPATKHGGAFQLVRIDPETGSSKSLGDLHGAPYVAGASLSPDGGTVAYLVAGNMNTSTVLRLRSMADGKEGVVFSSLEVAVEYLEGMRSEVQSATRGEGAANFERFRDAAAADVEEALKTYPGHSRLIELQNDIINARQEK